MISWKNFIVKIAKKFLKQKEKKKNGKVLSLGNVGKWWLSVPFVKKNAKNFDLPLLTNLQILILVPEVALIVPDVVKINY